MMIKNKYALVFGNGEYSESMRLSNPRNDAEALSTILSALNFRVSTYLDQKYEEMQAAITTFVSTIANEPAAVGLFYFSGHGLQIQDQNFIVPIDFDDPVDHCRSGHIALNQGPAGHR
jgi:uncharacterized caspase-like protein